MVILGEEKVGGERHESSSEDGSEVESDDVPGDDFKIDGSGDEEEGGEHGDQSSDNSSEEEESGEDDLDDTLKEEDWKRESKKTEGARKSSDDEDDDEDNEDNEDDDLDREEMNDEGDDEASEDEVDEEGNTGWADAMAKVLAMGKNSEKTVGVLSKAKKDNAKEKGSDGKVLEPLALRKARKRELDSIGRGVVQLFNAVREQQKDMKSQLRQAGGSFRKQEKVLKTINKANFINMLSGKAMVEGDEPAEKRCRLEKEEEQEEGDEEMEQKQSSWNILRDDFMLGAKMKDWDQESDGD